MCIISIISAITHAASSIISHLICIVHKDVTICQTAARKYLAVKKTDAIRYKRDMAIAKVKFANMKACMAAHTILQYRCSALRLQRYWRGWAVKQQYKQLMIGMITFFHELSCSLPCTHLLTFAVFLYHNYSDITNMQARARRYLALTRFKALKHLVACVIRVQAWLRCGVAKWTFTAYRCKVLPLQALGRRVIARSRFLRTTRGKFQLGS